MSNMNTHKIFVIGGTGAQGIPVVEALTKDNKYQVLILTRDTKNTRAQQLAKLPGVQLLEGTFTDEALVLNAYKECDGAFVNIDGFNTGEKAEIFWGMRMYELAREAGSIKFYVWGNLDYAYKKGGYNPKYRCGHYDGKGRVGEWVLQQPNDAMGAALFTTGPYMEMAISAGTPVAPQVVDGVVTWAVPLGTGAIPHIALSDCGHYVRHLFDHPARSNGLDLAVATAHITYAELAAAFTRVTGRPAQHIDLPLEEYFSTRFPPSFATKPCGYNADVNDPATMTQKENFTGFWHTFRDSGDNQGVVRRDYALLDSILPGRIRGVEEWLRTQGTPEELWERVNRLPKLLKIHEDGGKGRL